MEERKEEEERKRGLTLGRDVRDEENDGKNRWFAEKNGPLAVVSPFLIGPLWPINLTLIFFFFQKPLSQFYPHLLVRNCPFWPFNFFWVFTISTVLVVFL